MVGNTRAALVGVILFGRDILYVVLISSCVLSPPGTVPINVLPTPLNVTFLNLQGLKELGELVASYQGLRDNGARGPSIVSASIACARKCNLDKDIKDLPGDDVDCKTMTLDVSSEAAAAELC